MSCFHSLVPRHGEDLKTISSILPKTYYILSQIHGSMAFVVIHQFIIWLSFQLLKLAFALKNNNQSFPWWEKIDGVGAVTLTSAHSETKIKLKLELTRANYSGWRARCYACQLIIYRAHLPFTARAKRTRRDNLIATPFYRAIMEYSVGTRACRLLLRFSSDVCAIIHSLYLRLFFAQRATCGRQERCRHLVGLWAAGYLWAISEIAWEL
jgi:hypothetical protein